MQSVRDGEVSEDAKAAAGLKRVRRRGRAGEGPARERRLGTVFCVVDREASNANKNVMGE